MTNGMNERIKELAAQVEKYISTTNFEGMPEDEMTYDEIFQKKFAELIVRECTNMLPPDSIRDKNGVHMFYVIRKHFGVE
jgi:hypothetical protein